jgi:hypothetical protein
MVYKGVDRPAPREVVVDDLFIKRAEHRADELANDLWEEAIAIAPAEFLRLSPVVKGAFHAAVRHAYLKGMAFALGVETKDVRDLYSNGDPAFGVKQRWPTLALVTEQDEPTD